MDLDDDRESDPVDEILSADLGPVAESGGGRWGTRQKKVKELTPEQFERAVTQEIVAFVGTGKMMTPRGPIFFHVDDALYACRRLHDRDPDALKTLAATPGRAGEEARSFLMKRAKIAARDMALEAPSSGPKPAP